MSKVTCVYFSLHKNIFVLKKGTRKMNKLKELRNKVKKNNKGFSLVELIVVIVILAILIGVTIGGIYQYVNKSRINTDINNAASIQSTLATIATDEKVAKAIPIPASGKTTDYYIQWSAKGPLAIPTDDSGKEKIATRIGEILTDGFPKAQSDSTFEIKISKDDEGNISATCKVYEVTQANPLKPVFNTKTIATANNALEAK